MYYDENIPGDRFKIPDDIDNAKITAKEVKNVTLNSHFRANKSTGLSCLPLQGLKWMSKQAHPMIAADVFNKSAIE